MNALEDPDTFALLRRAHAGDDEAWTTVVIRHGGDLRRLARAGLDSRLRMRFDPDDVAQEALLDAFRTLGRFFEAPILFSAWLRQRLADCVSRIHRDHLLTQKRCAARAADAGVGWDDRLADPGSSPSGRAMRAEHVRRLHGVLGELAEVDRNVITLFFFERHDAAEIQSILGLGPEAVRKRLSRAIARFEDLLRRSHPEWCDDLESPGRRRP